MYTQPEVFNDLRRNNFPALTPTSGSQIPVRWNYPSDELLFNSNAEPFTTTHSLFSPAMSWGN